MTRTEQVRIESAALPPRGPRATKNRAAATRPSDRFDQPRDHEVRRQLRALREFGG